MKDEEEFKKLCRDLLSAAPGFSGSALASLAHICGDASGRRYYRLLVNNGAARSVILMGLAHGAGPVVHADKAFNQDDTYVELSAYLIGHGFKVPRVLLDRRAAGYLLIEDFGDIALWQFIFNRLSAAGEKIAAGLGDEAAVSLYKQAVNILVNFRKLEPENCVAFQRSMGFEEYRAEAQRFIDHYLIPNNFSKSIVELFREKFNVLCEEITSHPRIFCYRDFMPWNIQVLPDGELGLLDFQDALLGSDAYDLVSLLHDRDADFQAGPAFVARLIKHFRDQSGVDAKFLKRYRQVLLQRHFRLAGQFDMLSKKFNRDTYRGWIPGCFRRIGQVIAFDHDFDDVTDILYKSVSPFREGLDCPLEL